MPVAKMKSKDYQALVAVLSGENISWPVAALAARAITAYARVNQWMVESGKKNLGAYELGELVIDLGEKTEEIIPLVEKLQAGSVNLDEFAQKLEVVVLYMEQWVVDAAERTDRVKRQG